MPQVKARDEARAVCMPRPNTRPVRLPTDLLDQDDQYAARVRRFTTTSSTSARN